MNTFTLSGTLNDGQNNPIINKYVRFRVTSVGTDTEDGAVYPRNSFDFKTDSSGDLQGESGSNTVWVNGDSGTQCYYEISLPDGQKVDVVLPSAVEGTTVSLDDIIENYQVDGGTQQSTTLASAKAYTDVLAADPTNNASFTGAAPANWRSGLNVADGAQVNDPTTVLDADIGVTVQAYDATLLNDADIGVTVQAYDPTIVNDADIGVTVQAYDPTIVNDADIGVNVQAHDDGLDDISGLAVTDGNIIVGDGANWVAESGATARTSLGVSIGSDVQAHDDGLDDLAGLTPTNESIVKGDGTNWVAATNFRVDAGTSGTGTEMGTGTANGDYSVACGDGTEATGDRAFATGLDTEASGDYSVAMGRFSRADQAVAMAFGLTAIASGSYAVSLGRTTIASGESSFAGGHNSTASGDYARAEGRRAKAIHDGARVESDSQDSDVSSTITDQYTARFQNGYVIEEGRLTAKHGISTPTTSVTATTYTTLATDSVILVDDDTAAAEVTVTLLAAATAGDGFLLNIKKTGSTANVVIDGNGAETIDGATTNTLTTQYESVKLICDGTEWHII